MRIVGETKCLSCCNTSQCLSLCTRRVSFNWFVGGEQVSKQTARRQAFLFYNNHSMSSSSKVERKNPWQYSSPESHLSIHYRRHLEERHSIQFFPTCKNHHSVVVNDNQITERTLCFFGNVEVVKSVFGGKSWYIT